MSNSVLGRKAVREERRLVTPRPPRVQAGHLGWVWKNLFSTPLNAALTLFSVYLLYLAIPPVVQWVFIDADWVGDGPQDCSTGGACWVFVRVRLYQFMYGFYPQDQVWRVNLGFGILIALLVPLLMARIPGKSWIAAFLLLLYPVIGYLLFYGGAPGLPVVETAKWGGLMLTLILSGVGIAGALPAGVLLALGRRSKMPVVKAVCVAFIELWRGVPLITVLFMASVMLPLFLPEGMSFDKLLRALTGIVLFQSAYVAEVVRGGLQAIPRGQYEAAEALGLSYWRCMGLIVLPQALKLVIPGMVNTLIALYKDTTLVLIIGLFDLLAIVQAAFADPRWLGYALEGYLFAALIYWCFCFGMSRYSQHLERTLQTGYREAGA
jgi:general L-amino acid transport system permease protein